MAPTTRIRATRSHTLGRGARVSTAMRRSCSVIERAPCRQSLVLRVQANTENRGRASVAVIGGIDDQLIVERDLRGKPGKAVIGLEDAFVTRMRQLAVADQDTKAAGVEKRLMNIDDAIVDAGNAPDVVVAPPQLAGHRESRRDSAVDVGEVERLLVAVGPAGAGEEADILVDLLLEIHADAAAALIFAHRGDVGRRAGCSRKQDRVLEAAHAGPGQETGDGDLAGLAEDRIAPLDLAVPLELPEMRIQRIRVRRNRCVKYAAAERPWT